MKAYLSFASHVSQCDDEKVEKKLYSFVCIDRWRFGGLRGTQRPNMGAGVLQNTAMERRDGAALGNPYPRSSCACQVGVGRLQLQRIAVETTVRHAAWSKQLPTATRVIWERAMGCRGAPRHATSAARAARPPAARIRAHAHHHVAKRLYTLIVGPSCLNTQASEVLSQAPRGLENATNSPYGLEPCLRILVRKQGLK